jgi:hypothetical protein
MARRPARVAHGRKARRRRSQGRGGRRRASAWAALGAHRPVCGGLEARRPRLRAKRRGGGSGSRRRLCLCGSSEKVRAHVFVVDGLLDGPPNKSPYHFFASLFYFFFFAQFMN